MGLSNTASRIMAHRHPIPTGGNATSKQHATILSNNGTLLSKRKLNNLSALSHRKSPAPDNQGLATVQICVLCSLVSRAREDFFDASLPQIWAVNHFHSSRPFIKYQILGHVVAIRTLLVFLNQFGNFKHKSKASLTLYEPKHYGLMKLGTFSWFNVHCA